MNLVCMLCVNVFTNILNLWKINGEFIFVNASMNNKKFFAKGNLEGVDFNVYNIMLKVWWAEHGRNVNRKIVVCVRNDLKSIM
jgi:hypothetical protein